MDNFISERITGNQNKLISRLAKLSDKKYRDSEGLFRLDGEKLFAEAVRSNIEFEYVFISESRLAKADDRMKELFSSVGTRIILIPDCLLPRLTDEKAPQGVIGFAKKFPTVSINEIPDNRFSGILLSSIRDPGNLGTIIRTAYAFGIDRVYVSRDCADIYSPKTIRAGMGSVFRQKISVADSETELIRFLKENNVTTFASALRKDAEKVGGIKLPDRVCIAVGNEGHGLSEEVVSACGRTLTIPMNPQCESLNAAGAAAVLIWEMSRERLLI